MTAPKIHPRGKKTPTAKVQKSQPNLSREEKALLSQLASLLPPSPCRAPENIVNQAAAYIDQLTATIHARIASGQLPSAVLSALPQQPTSRRVSLPKKRRSIEKKR